jgi:hypothetical protein
VLTDGPNFVPHTAPNRAAACASLLSCDQLVKDPGGLSIGKPRSTVNPKTEVRRASARRAIHPRWADPSAAAALAASASVRRGIAPPSRPCNRKIHLAETFLTLRSETPPYQETEALAPIRTLAHDKRDFTNNIESRQSIHRKPRGTAPHRLYREKGVWYQPLASRR